MNKTLIIFILLLEISPAVWAQSSAGSPYTVFGVGDRVNKGFGKSQGLGGVGIGLRDGFSLNNTNPASYTAISAPFTQLAQFGLSVTRGEQHEGGESSTYSNLSFSGVAFWFRTTNKSGLSFGLVPYSSVGYSLAVNQTFSGLPGKNSVTYKGSGGFSQLYVGAGYELFKNFSIGAHASYIFGPFKQDLQIAASEYVNNIAIEKNLFLNTLDLDFGAQYSVPFNKSTLTLGVVYDLKNKLGATYAVNITETSSDGLETISESSESVDGYILPTTLGGGISWNHKNKWMFATDVSFEQWGQAKFEEGYSLRNSQRFSGGISIIPNRGASSYFKRVGIDFGAYFENTYLIVNGVGINDHGFSVGLDIPVAKTIFSLSFQQSYRLPEIKGTLLKENYSQITLNISLFDIWFNRPQYD